MTRLPAILGAENEASTRGSVVQSDLADRIRASIGNETGVVEIGMFGGICFMLNGNMLVGTMRDASLLARVGADGLPAALAQPGASALAMGKRQMKGYVQISPEYLDDAALHDWIAVARRHVDTLPPKPTTVGKPAKSKRQ